MSTTIYPEQFSGLDDTLAVQAAINAVPTRGAGAEVILTRQYNITSPIEIISDARHNYRRGITIRGMNAGTSGTSLQTGLVWAGPAGQPVIKLYSRDNLLCNFSISAASGHEASCAIEVDQVSGEVANTRNCFEYLRIDGGIGMGTNGRIINGVVIGPRTGIYNLDFHYFRQCVFVYMEEACVWIASDTGQSKHHTFDTCGFLRSKYGIKQVTGSFEARGCAFSSLTQAAISLYGPTDSIYLTSPDSEWCPRFIESRAGGSSGWPLTISGGRFELNSLHPDGRYIDYLYSGPLFIQGATFSNVPVERFKIRVGAGGVGARLISIGNQFPNATPYEMIPYSHLISLGNRGLDSIGNGVLLADQFAGTGVSVPLSMPLPVLTKR